MYNFYTCHYVENNRKIMFFYQDVIEFVKKYVRNIQFCFISGLVDLHLTYKNIECI